MVSISLFVPSRREVFAAHFIKDAIQIEITKESFHDLLYESIKYKMPHKAELLSYCLHMQNS